MERVRPPHENYPNAEGVEYGYIFDNLPGAAVPYVNRQRPKNEKAEAETRQVKAGAAEATDKALTRAIDAGR